MHGRHGLAKNIIQVVSGSRFAKVKLSHGLFQGDGGALAGFELIDNCPGPSPLELWFMVQTKTCVASMDEMKAGSTTMPSCSSRHTTVTRWPGLLLEYRVAATRSVFE